MNENSTKLFAILCQTDITNRREAQRLVVMRKFLSEGLGSNISVRGEFAVPDYHRTGLVVLVEAPSREAIEAEIGFCDDVFHTSISAVEYIIGNLEEFRCARFAGFVLQLPDANYPDSAAAHDDPSTELVVKLDEGATYHAIILSNADTFASAHFMVSESYPHTVVETHYCEPLASLFERKTAKAEDPVQNLVASTVLTGPDRIVARKASAAYAAVDAAMPFTEQLAMATTPMDKETPVTQRTMIWTDGPFTTPMFSFSVNWSWVNNFFPPNYDYSTVVNWAPSPHIISGAGNGTLYEFAARGPDLLQAHVESPLSIWLGKLLQGKEFDKPWPEDDYVGEMRAAYDYIVSRLPGATPPKKGTLKKTGQIDVIDYPGEGHGFGRTEFDAVKKHLILEVDYFATVDDWFGISGIMDAINRGTAIVSQNDLTEAANYMQIPVKTTSLIMTLDGIFNVLLAVISAIPIAGSALSAYLRMSWYVVKTNLPNGTSSKPIQAAIAEIADHLNNYFIAMESAAEHQRQLLYANFGRLEQFSYGVVTGIISEQMFLDGSGPSGENSEPGTRDHNGITKIHRQVQRHAADAWLLYCYQQLFTASHQVAVTVSFAPQPPTNPWNPTLKDYRFSWSIPCIYKDGKSVEQTGYMILDCKTDAPEAAMEQLFGSDSRLQVVPIDFFASLNGWKTGYPTWYAGYQNLSGHAPPVPVTQLGLKAWGDVIRNE